MFAALTQAEEEAGLLDSAAAIGTRHAWLSRVEAHGYTIEGHRLVPLP